MRTIFMINNPEKIVNTTNMKIPPFRYYFVVSFFLAAFILVLDCIYRSDAFLTRMKFFQVVANGIFLWLPIFLLLLLFSLVLWGLDALTYLIFFSKCRSSHSHEMKFVNYISGFIYYSVFAYSNIIYLRLYMSSFIPGVMKDGMLTGIGLISSVSLAAALLIYIFSVRKTLHSDDFRKNINHLFKPLLALLLIFCLVFASAFLSEWQSRTRKIDNNSENKKEKPHILFITLDNLRATNMSLYGFDLKTTPFLEKYASESSVFDNMIAGSTQTTTSIPIIISGKYLLKQFPEASSFFQKSLPKILEENGYKKRCFVSPLSMNLFPKDLFTDFVILNDLKGDPVKSLSWLGKSRESLVWFSYFFSEDERFFSVYSIRDPRDLDFHRTTTIMSAAGEYIIKTMKNSKEPVFIWAHFMKTHPPYNPPEIFRERFYQSYDLEVNKYNACISYVDYELGNIIKRLKAEGLYDNTLIVINSDHGYYFQTEILSTSIRLDESSPESYLRLTGPFIDVPLIIHEPGQNGGKRIKAIAQHCDIAPTILELAGINAPPEMDGESLVPYLRGLKEKSDRVKLCVSADYFYNQKVSSPSESNTRQFGLFCAFYDHYAMELALLKPTAKNGKRNNTIWDDETFPCHVIGIYDINNDKRHSNNLMETNGMKDLIHKVLESQWLRYYGK